MTPMGMFGKRIHFAWIVAALIFLVLIIGAGVRATPSVLIVPLENEFGWTRASISLAIGINIFVYGFLGPFIAAAMQRFGIRPIVMAALALLSATVAASTLITQEWQLIVTWGLLVGIGSGSTAMVLGAMIATRWFTERRGLVMGVLAASTATGQLIFLPSLAAVVGSGLVGVRLRWSSRGAAAAVIPGVFFPAAGDLDATAAEVRAARSAGPLPAVPLFVVSAGVEDDASQFPPGWPMKVEAQLHRELQADLVTLIPGGRQIVATKSTHYVHRTQPALVVDAVHQAVTAARLH